MTAHAYELIGAARDEVLDDASDAFLRVHLRECADCRRYEREVSHADRLIAQREPSPAIPSFETVRRHGERRQWSLIALAASTVILIAAVAGLALRERNAAAEPSRPVLGSALAGIWLGASPDDVIRRLGLPDRRTGYQELAGFVTYETHWVYERGLWVIFSGCSFDPSSVVVSIVAWPGSGAQTEEGFNVDDGDRAAFRAIYSGSDLDEQQKTDPWTSATGFEPNREIVVTGRDRDGRTVQLSAHFEGERPAHSLALSRARAPGEACSTPSP